MHEGRAFRRKLRGRLLGIAGAASLMAPHAACKTAIQASVSHASSASTSGATTSATVTAAATTGAGMGGAAIGGAGGAGGAPLGPLVTSCFDLPVNTTACPTDQTDALTDFLALGCPTGWEPLKVLSGPMTNEMNQCCYSTELRLCTAAGRPYVQGDMALRSPPMRSSGGGWAEGPRPEIDPLSAEERAWLAHAWLDDALMEHASVASFSRFSLALLALGAPADLVERAHRAALDEVAHAQLAFALASRYAGTDVAPGRFPVGDRIDVPSTLADLAASTVREGAIGETIAAALANEAASRATDPAVRDALERIARDEAEHACLAWETITWAIRTGGSDVREAVRIAFEDGLTLGVEAPPGAPTRATEAHGRLTRADATAIISATIDEVIRPAAAALV